MGWPFNMNLGFIVGAINYTPGRIDDVLRNESIVALREITASASYHAVGRALHDRADYFPIYDESGRELDQRNLWQPLAFPAPGLALFVISFLWEPPEIASGFDQGIGFAWQVSLPRIQRPHAMHPSATFSDRFSLQVDMRSIVSASGMFPGARSIPNAYSSLRQYYESVKGLKGAIPLPRVPFSRSLATAEMYRLVGYVNRAITREP